MGLPPLIMNNIISLNQNASNLRAGVTVTGRKIRTSKFGQYHWINSLRRTAKQTKKYS